MEIDAARFDLGVEEVHVHLLDFDFFVGAGHCDLDVRGDAFVLLESSGHRDFERVEIRFAAQRELSEFSVGDLRRKSQIDPAGPLTLRVLPIFVSKSDQIEISLG